ncbi:hypothetical protein D3C87_1440660 [compost metagenome]|jgi:hypothetical protein|uniref:hypothetical protein n=1 Tax=Sphingobacterium faecium TaxID=34087 RepID=UPI000D3B494B|nr:hypothetical protein [Sphingobacterium faecium]MQP29331.1 hypothetical protein [Sphingobacterium faecium]PTX13690.1 hypothetical protein C8N37_101439 [Sphingobacterium faecium]GEM65381.1 hypothetical protein SF1_33630 [Sphingobacterium faecium NBRC 15299]
MHTEFEKLIIDSLLKGKTQQEISIELKSKGVVPYSLSSIEKTMNDLKRKHQASTLFQLGAIITLKRYIHKKE